MQHGRYMILTGAVACFCLLVPAAGLATETIAYSYDAMGRLTQASYDSGAGLDYAYDMMGNRLSQDVDGGEPVNHAPNEPSNPSVADGAADVSLGPLLSWSGGDPDEGDTLLYEVYFGGDPDELLLVSTQSETSYPASLLDPFSSYFWQIVAYDSSGATTAGAIWSFTTGGDDNPVPEAGTLLLLAGGLLGLLGIWRRQRTSPRSL